MHSRELNSAWLAPALICCWLLTLITFSAPGRDGPGGVDSLDPIGLAKVLVRLGSLVFLGLALLRLWSSPRRPLVIHALLPFGCYLAWAFVSASWSALPSFSFGQALGLLVLLLLTAVLGILADSPRHVSQVLFHLSLALFVVSTFLTGLDMVRHDLSGLDRLESDPEGSAGLVHPTSAGATASLGLVILLAVNLFWRWRWARLLLIPAVPVHSALLILANSRMAIIMAVAVLGIAVLFYLQRQLLAAGLLVVSVLGTLFLVVDPRFEIIERTVQSVTAKLTRGESSETLSSLTGRTALWDAIWASFREAPLRGHGYFVTSHNGLLDVWSGPANRTAHNVFLQVLVTTGLIGFALFMWAMAQLLWSIYRGLQQSPHRMPLLAFLILLGLWYLGWTQLCESFMGPIQPEAVVFYTLLGLALGQGSEGGRIENPS